MKKLDEQMMKLTIIIPLFNEVENLPRLEQEMNTFLSHADFSTKILIVNDGSTDNSQELIDKICATNSNFSSIQFEKNVGLSGALKAGIDYADSEYIGYIDADLQTSPEDFLKLWEFAKEYPLVLGIRSNRKDSFIKNLSSKIANAIRRSFTNDGVSDTGCPLKIIKTEYAKKLPLFSGMHRFIPALIKLQNGSIKQVPVQHFPRKAGKSKYHLWNRLIGPFVDLFIFLWMKKRYVNYKVIKINE